MSAGADIAEAAKAMGMLLAWAINHQLVDETKLSEHEQTLLRIRYGEVQGSTLLVALGGDLNKDIFSAKGKKFMDRYYPNYLADLSALFGHPHNFEDNQDSYARIAGMLTKAFMQKPQATGGMLNRLRGWLGRKK